MRNISGIAVTGENKINLDLNNFSTGTYYVILHYNESDACSLKLIRQ